MISWLVGWLVIYYTKKAPKIFLAEELRLQRNLENYHLLNLSTGTAGSARQTTPTASRLHPGAAAAANPAEADYPNDRRDFVITKVSFHFLSSTHT